MSYLNDNELANIRNSISIVDVISNYIPLTPKGKNYFGVCPFHEDHSPSMSVSQDKQIYKCFSCGATGNVFTFIMNYLNLTFTEAILKVAEMAGVSLDKDINFKQPKKYKNEYELMDITCKLYQNNLHSDLGIEALSYLKKRGIDEEIIKSFNIGLALDDNSLYKILSKKGYSDQIISDLGIINITSNGIFDVFQNRIMIPIHNLTGECVGFTGRIYKNNNSAKYINSKETKIFKKGDILFNYHLARDSIRLKKEVIIVEGNMDAIRMYSCGIKNCIALMGTSLTKQQVDTIKKLRVKVILMFDNDNAGEVATFNNGNILEKAGMNINVVRLSGEKDPDEYILKNGIEALEDVIKSSISFMEFKMNYLKSNKNLNDSKELADYIKLVIDSLKDITDPILKEITLQKLANDYNISYSVLASELEKLPVKIQMEVFPEEKKTVKSNLEKLEEEIVFYMMNGYNYVTIYSNKLGILPDKIYRAIANEVVYFYSNNKMTSLADFLSFTEKSLYKEEIMNIISTNNDISFNEDSFIELINIMQNKMEREKIKNLKEEMNKEFDINRKIELANKLLEIKKGSVVDENN